MPTGPKVHFLMVRFSSWEKLVPNNNKPRMKIFRPVRSSLPTQSPSLSTHKVMSLQKLKHKTLTKTLRRIQRHWTWWNDKWHQALLPQLRCSHRASWHTPWRYRGPCKASFLPEAFPLDCEEEHVNAVSAMNTTCFMWFYCLGEPSTLRIEKHHVTDSSYFQEPKCQLA